MLGRAKGLISATFVAGLLALAGLACGEKDEPDLSTVPQTETGPTATTPTTPVPTTPTPQPAPAP